MVKHTQTIRQLLAVDCLSVFDHFVGLVFKGLSRSLCYINSFVGTLCNELVKEFLHKLRKGLFRTLQASKMKIFCKNS